VEKLCNYFNRTNVSILQFTKEENNYCITLESYPNPTNLRFRIQPEEQPLVDEMIYNVVDKIYYVKPPFK
jgi:hypothetical protein